MPFAVSTQPYVSHASYFWGFALLIALLVHGIVIWKAKPWLEKPPYQDQLLEVEFLDYPTQAIPPIPTYYPTETPKFVPTPPPPVPEQTEQMPETDSVLLNDLIEKEDQQELSMKLQKSAQSSVLSNKTVPSPQPLGIPESTTRTASPDVDEQAVASVEVPPTPLVPQDQETLTETTPSELANEMALLTVPEPSTQESLSTTDLSTEAEAIPMEKKSQSTGQTSSALKNLPELPDNYFLQPAALNAPIPKNTTEVPAKSFPKTQSNRHPPPPGSVEAQRYGPNDFYMLSNYNWPYESYMGRWAKALIFGWRNNPPQDWVTGMVPQGGDVWIQVTISKDGNLTSYEVTGVRGASLEMEESVINAVLSASSLPPLPSDFADNELTVHFRFLYPPIRYLYRK